MRTTGEQYGAFKDKMEVYERRSIQPFSQPEELPNIIKMLSSISTKLANRYTLRRGGSGSGNTQDKLDEAVKELAVLEIDLESVNKLA